MKVDVEVDTKHMACPMPLLKLKQALNKMDSGQQLHLIATDKTSIRDFKAFIAIADHHMEYEERGEELHYFITKG